MNGAMLVLGVLAGLGWLAMRVHDWRAGAGDGADVWARPAQIKPLRVEAPGGGRLVLGRVGSHLIASEARHSVLVLGATDTGKTTGLAIPAILEWDGPILAVSVKGDLVRDTLAHRSEQGNVWTYDPFGTTGLPCSKWTPLAASVSWPGATRVAEAICSAAKSRHAGPGGDDFWNGVSQMLLAPLLFAAANTGASASMVGRLTMADVVRWVRRQVVDEPRALIRATGVSEALDAFDANCSREERQLSGIYTTLELILTAFADPVVAESFKGSEITAAALLDGGRHTLYVCAPSDDQERYEAVFTTIVRQMLSVAMAKGGRARLDPPLLVVLDEAANIAPVRNLAKLASTAAAAGVQLVSVFQDLSQVQSRYGDGANTVINNHRAKVVLGGGSDETALKWVETLVGDSAVSQRSQTKGDGRASTTDSTTYRSAAPPELVRQIRPGEGLLIYGHHPPARLRLRPWYSDPGLKKLVNG